MAKINKSLAAGIGALGAVGAASAVIVGGLNGQHSEGGEFPFGEFFEAPDAICLRSDIPFIEGLNSGCYSKDALTGFSRKPVLDNNGEPVVIRLSHPADDLQRPTEVTTCSVFTDIYRQGWYAPSSREMRREAYFVRACGTLDLLAEAQKPEISYFTKGGLTDGDVRGLADGPPFRMSASVEIEPRSTTMEKVGARQWRLRSGTQLARLQEIAHADFNDDAVGDILAFVFIGADEGTAMAGVVGIVEKTSKDDPVRFESKF